MLPYAECILRVTPTEMLGHRSPYQIVTGLQPKLPRSLVGSGPIVAIGTGEYCEKLLTYLRDCYRSVRAQADALREEEEIQAQDLGTLGMELCVGDLVMIRLDNNKRPKGTKRFHSKVGPEIWKIKGKVSPHTFRLCSANDETVLNNFTQHATNLIRIELPELDFDSSRKRILELSNDRTGAWDRYRIEKFSVDGRCQLRRLHQRPGAHPILTQYEEEPTVEWFDLSKHIYRWIV